MKVILTAFGGELKGEIKNWPDPLADEIFWSLPYLRQRDLDSLKHPEEAAANPPGSCKGKFRRTGRSFEQEDGSLAFEYALVDLHPLKGCG